MFDITDIKQVYSEHQFIYLLGMPPNSFSRNVAEREKGRKV